MLGIIVVAILGTVGVVWLVTRPGSEHHAPVTPSVPTASSRPASTARASVAVMPFANLTGDASKDYLGDGMAEELINVLVKVPGLSVPSRTSSFAYKGRNTDLKQIAKDLNVATILEGSVRSAGETIRVTAQLIDAQTDRHLWSETYTQKSSDLFKLQDDLAREIVAAFKTTMNADLPDVESQARPTKDVEAYGLYLQGSRVHQSQFRPFRSSMQSMPGKRPSRVTRGLPWPTWPWPTRVGCTESRLPMSNVMAARQSSLIPSLADTAKAVVFAGVEAKRRNWGAAEEIFRTLPPNSKDPSIHNFYVLSVLWPTGQLHRVLMENAEAQRLAPASAAITLQFGMASAAAGRDADAVKYADAAGLLGVDTAGRRSKQLYADIAARAGRYSEAADLMVSVLPPGLRAVGGDDVVTPGLYGNGRFRAQAGSHRRIAEAQFQARPRGLGNEGVEHELVLASSVRWILPTTWPNSCALQFKDQSPTNAWAWLWTPEMSAFRQDPRFQAFTTRLGLMAFWQKYGPPDNCDLQGTKLTCH